MLLCIVLVKLPFGALFLALMSSGLGHIAFIGVTVLLLVGACSAFCSLGLVALACLSLLVVLLALSCC